MKTKIKLGICLLLTLLLQCGAMAQTIESQILTDKVHSGSGVIDLLKDISGSNLASYFTQQGNLLLLGVDLNEDNSGNESRDSIGVAIKDAQLSILTTAGSFTFTDFYTSTSAMLKETGSSTASEYYTLFGDSGSSQITGSGTFDISKFDDVMWFENIDFIGDILGAELTVHFLDTGKDNRGTTEAETFFDYSGGFEDFAIFSAADAVLLEEQNVGVEAAPSTVNYTTEGTVVQAIVTATETNITGPIPTVPAAPAPPLAIGTLMALLLAYKLYRLQSIKEDTLG